MRQNKHSTWVLFGLALVLPLTAMAAPRTLFFDDFNRADGVVEGSGWVEDSLAPTGQALCADVQSPAELSRAITQSHVGVSFTFRAAADSGFEAYVMAKTAAGPYLVGCAGGFGTGRCTPAVMLLAAGKTPRAPDPLRLGPAVELRTDTSYGVQAEFDGGLITVAVSDADGTVLSSVALSTDARIERFGLVVGRQADGALTCVDDFRIVDLSAEPRLVDQGNK